MDGSFLIEVRGGRWGAEKRIGCCDIEETEHPQILSNLNKRKQRRLKQGQALPILSLEGRKEPTFRKGNELGVLESAPVGARSSPASSRGPRVARRRAPLARAAFLVGALLSAFALLHVCMRPQRSREAVKKSGVARRRLAEGGGRAGDNEDDEAVQALIEDCLSLAEDLARQSASESSPEGRGIEWVLPVLGSSQGAASNGGAGLSSSSWTAAPHPAPPGFSALGPPQLSSVPAIPLWRAWGTSRTAEEAALLSALDSGSWLDQIPLINPQLQSNSWLENIPSITPNLPPPQSQGTQGAPADAGWGPSLGEGFFPQTAPSSFPPFTSGGPPPLLDTSYYAAAPHPETHEAPQAAAPPTTLGGLAVAAEGPRAAVAEQAEGGTRSTSGGPETLRELLRRGLPQEPLIHPFVRLPTVHQASIPRTFNPDAPLYPAHKNLRLPSLLMAVHELYTLSTLTTRQVEELLNTLESIVYFSRKSVHFRFQKLFACSVASKVAFYVLTLDALVAGREILGGYMRFDLWFKDFARLFEVDFQYQATKLKFTLQATFYWKMIVRLRAAMKTYKKGVRPPANDIILYKRMIFCSSMSPPCFLKSDYEPWRHDDRTYREAAGDFPGESDDEFGVYEAVREKYNLEDEADWASP
ncbi:hypothetical protein Emag_006194 [Eimeria magna]